MCLKHRLKGRMAMLIGSLPGFVVPLALCAVFGSTSVSQAAGMSTSLGEVLLTGLQIGTTYQLSTLAGFKLSCQNNSDYPMTISMKVGSVSQANVKKGFKPLPDTSWIELEKSSFLDVPPKRNVFNDVFFKIPDNKKFRGGRYQFYVEMEGGRTGKVQGMGRVAVGLRSRFLIAIASTETAKAPGVERGAFPFSLEPSDIFLGKLKPGRVYNLSKDLGKKITLVNPNEVPLNIRLESLTAKEADVKPRKGFPDEPKPQFLSFIKSAVTVLPKGEAAVQPFLWIPDEPEQRGKRYMFILKATSQTGIIPFKVYSRIYVSVKGKRKKEK